ncbi:uncharacterized protein PRCAT00001191001 [Priceomyces carsonii]|uniref:uncharacterized protein n=1 Tax=Priceomyces carsonii TaxID=28549 RepID=UPI002EDAF7D4|nr:unnamed protein product [Priceomyces carsonii]
MSKKRSELSQSSGSLNAPIPIKRSGVSIPRVRSLLQLDYESRKQHTDGIYRTFTPMGYRESDTQDKEYLYSCLEFSRQEGYNLDYPEGWDEIERCQLDPKSRFFARERPRTLNLPGLLPYEIETPKDQAKFLSHIVSHLYIAIKTLDIQGSLPVTAKDLAALKDGNGFSDIDLALGTNLFEMASEFSQGISHEIDEENDIYDDIPDHYSDDDMEYDEDDSMDDDFDDDRETVNQHKKSPKSAAVVSVRIWTHELLVWLKMKYEMPLSLRMALAKVYYSICLSRGQQLSLKIYVKTFEILTKDIVLLKRHRFKLPWEGLYNELENLFPPVYSSHEQFEKKDHKLLHRLAERASNFFDDDSLPTIYSKLGSNFSIPNASIVLSSMAILPHRFNKGGRDSPTDIRHYISSLFHLWLKLNRISGIETHLTSRLGTIAMDTLLELHRTSDSHKYLILDDFGVFSAEQMDFLFNTLINSLSIMNDKYSSMKSKFFHGFSSTIVFSMVGEKCLGPDGILEKFESLMKDLESYIHPSNSGDWSRPISKLISSLIYQFHKRYNMERLDTLCNLPNLYKLNDETTYNFVKIFLPAVKTGLQSKKSNCVDDYLTCLHMLAHLNPPLVLENVLSDIYESLEGVISTHRVSIAIRSMETLARYFASTPVFRVHITRIILLAILGIDSNDLGKTIHTLDMLATIANFVPFYDLTDGNSDPLLAYQITQEHIAFLQSKIYSDNDSNTFQIDNTIEIDALKSSTSSFKDIIKSLCDRICIILENLPDPSKSVGIEKDLAESLPRFLFVIFESMSDELLKLFRESFFEFVFDKTILATAEIAAEICGGIIKADPKSFKGICFALIDRIKENIYKHEAGSSRTGVDILPRDQPLFWNLLILNECVGNAGGYVKECAKELKDLSFSLMEVKGPTIFASSYLLNQILQSLTKIKLAEAKLISPLYIKTVGINEKCWGGFQFDELRFSKENMTFEWFIPDETDIDIAISCFNDHVHKTLSNILLLMKRHSVENRKDPNIILQLSDELRVNLLYLGYSLSGISYLIDPSFNDDIPKLSLDNVGSIKQRLLLLKTLRDMDYTSFADNDELRIETFHENLDNIVRNMNTEEGDDESSIENLERLYALDNSEPKKREEIYDSVSSEADVMSAEIPQTESALPSVEPSSRATPRIEDFDMSAMDPAITFRERKLYTSHYVFGDDIETRRSNPSYIRLHSIRELVGKSLHVICKFLITHFHDNVKLMKHYLYTLNIWFADVGRERLLDSNHSSINYGYISSIQRINRVRKPFTRMALGARIDAYHQLRVSLHATARTQTYLDKLLLDDIVKLSSSNYLAISRPAQSTLLDAMKRLNGSYNVIIKSSLQQLQKSFKTTNYKMMESVLHIFELKRLRNKLQSDYFNVLNFVDLLCKCLHVDNIEVNELAGSLLKSVDNGLTLPSSVCLIDNNEIDSIRPSDKYIDLEISVVKLAKERKRKTYLDHLAKFQNHLIFIEHSNNYWKATTLLLPILIDLLADFEMPSSVEVLKLVAKKCSTDHPVLARLALKGLTRLINKVYLLLIFEHDVQNLYDLEYLPKDVSIVKTSHVDGKSYLDKWESEIKNKEAPKYFIDHRANTGWLFWGDEMKVVLNQSSFKLDLNEDDKASLSALGECISVEWFRDIVRLWVTDNEVNTAFQGTDVYATASIVLLISNGFVSDLTFDKFLQTIKEIYVGDDKSTHIVSCELIGGILIGSKYIDPKLENERDNFIVPFLKDLFEKDLSPDNRGIWNIFSWWVPAHIDCRRFSRITDLFLDFSIGDSDSPIRDSTRLSYIRSFVASLTWSFSRPDEITDLCINNISNPYQTIRDQIGSLLAMLTFTFYNESISDSETFLLECNCDTSLSLHEKSSNKLLRCIPEIFESIEKCRREVELQSPQEILKSSYVFQTTAVLTWLKQILSTSAAIVYQRFTYSYIVPFLLKLINMKDVCLLGNIEPISVFKKVSQIPFSLVTLEQIVVMLEKYSSGTLSLIQLFIMGEFTETLYFKNIFKFTKTQRHRIINLTNKLVYHKNAEVRDSAASTLSGLMHLSPPRDIEELVPKFSDYYTRDLKRLRKKYKKTGYKKISADDTVTLHGATLGLGALVNAFPFASPPPKWVPEILTTLANKSSGINGLVGKTAKEILGKFRKSRQDTWHVDSQLFNEEQMEDLEGVLWKSYFI